MIELLIGGVMIVSAGFLAAGYYVPPDWLVALMWLAVGLRLFAVGLMKGVKEE